MTVQACTWIASPAFPRSDMGLLGACLASLHAGLQASGRDFSDRRLAYERAELPADADQELPVLEGKERGRRIGRRSVRLCDSGDHQSRPLRRHTSDLREAGGLATA
jgi:hypothetical protein